MAPNWESRSLGVSRSWDSESLAVPFLTSVFRSHTSLRFPAPTEAAAGARLWLAGFYGMDDAGTGRNQDVLSTSLPL